MKIGVDVDGVLTDLESYQLKYGKKYFKNVTDINEDGYDICDIFHCSKEESEAFGLNTFGNIVFMNQFVLV